jgi:hypothetical protein
VTGHEQDEKAAALVEVFLDSIKRETAALRERVDRLAVNLDNTLFELNPEFEVDFGWRVGSRPTSEFWMKVQYPARDLREAS